MSTIVLSRSRRPILSSREIWVGYVPSYLKISLRTSLPAQRLIGKSVTKTSASFSLFSYYNRCCCYCYCCCCLCRLLPLELLFEPMSVHVFFSLTCPFFYMEFILFYFSVILSSIFSEFSAIHQEETYK